MNDLEHIYWSLREWVNTPSLSTFNTDKEVVDWVLETIESERSGVLSKLDELESLCKNATPGPWFADFYNRTIRQSKLDGAEPYHEDFNIAKFPMRTNNSPIAHKEWVENAMFIALCREMVPKLIAVAKAAQPAIDCGAAMGCCTGPLEEALEDLEKE